MAASGHPVRDRARAGVRLVLVRGRRLGKGRHKLRKRVRRAVRNRLRALARLRRSTRAAALRRARPLLRLTYASSLAFVPSREELPEVLNRRGLVGRAAEVGVYRGAFSEVVLRQWRGRELVSVDPWLEQAEDAYVDRLNRPQDVQERIFAGTCERLAPYGDRSSIWRTTSVDAAEHLPPRSLDFVYIDARHDYASVREDLAAWFEKVRPGGLMAGHDYLDGDLKSGVYGVRSAVDEFFGGRGIRVHNVGDRPWPSWVVEAPEDPAGQGVDPPL